MRDQRVVFGGLQENFGVTTSWKVRQIKAPFHKDKKRREGGRPLEGRERGRAIAHG